MHWNLSGKDILEIMRDIQNFVGKHVYNLNAQTFFEKLSEAQEKNFLNIIGRQCEGFVSTLV